MTDNNKELEILDKSQVWQNTQKIVRQGGWEKGIFSNMINDFNNISKGFENYILNLKYLTPKQK